MKILYATSILFPSPLANRLQIVQMSEAFGAQLGEKFLLGIGRNESGEKISCQHIEMGKGIASYRLAWRYAKEAKNKNFTHVFTREPKLLFFLVLWRSVLRARFKIIFEIHQIDRLKMNWFRFALRRADFVISITEGIRQALRESNLPWEKTLVSPDAVDLAKFDVNLSVSDAREKLSLPKEKKIVLYTGSLETWKGVALLYEAAKTFNDSWLFLIVGGRQSWVDEFMGWYPETSNFKMLGHKSHNEIPTYLKAADVVVLPNLSTDPNSSICTSPMKLFEYMAARRPIVASKLPSIEEVLTAPDGEKRAIYFSPDSSEDLSRAIQEAFTRGDSSREVAAAYEAVRENTWEQRAIKVLNFLNK